jgi:hypothetical protein
VVGYFFKHHGSIMVLGRVVMYIHCSVEHEGSNSSQGQVTVVPGTSSDSTSDRNFYFESYFESC